MTVTHVSDFHIDRNRALAARVVSVIRGLKPDLCAFTGDYQFETSGPGEGVYAPMQSILSSVSSKHGVFGILGNHDRAEIAFAPRKWAFVGSSMKPFISGTERSFRMTRFTTRPQSFFR